MKLTKAQTKAHNEAEAILPQTSAGFRYSGERYYLRSESRKFKSFSEKTGMRHRYRNLPWRLERGFPLR